jgi:hypothetical protein
MGRERPQRHGVLEHLFEVDETRTGAEKLTDLRVNSRHTLLLEWKEVWHGYAV